MAQVAHLFHLDEKLQEDIIRTPLVIRAAAACLEMVVFLKHRRYCLEQWQNLEPSADEQHKYYYQQEFYEADRRIKQLEQSRQFAIADVIDLPRL
jgi:DNA primase